MGIRGVGQLGMFGGVWHGVFAGSGGMGCDGP